MLTARIANSFAILDAQKLVFGFESKKSNQSWSYCLYKIKLDILISIETIARIKTLTFYSMATSFLNCLRNPWGDYEIS